MWLKDARLQVSEEDAMKALPAACPAEAREGRRVKLHSLTNKKMLNHSEFRDVARARSA